MKKNELLEEKPNHGHYSACRTRKTEIDIFSKRVFTYTSIECVIMTAMLLGGIKMGAFSWIPSLLGHDYAFDIVYIIIQALEIIIFFALGLLGNVKNKIFDLIIFIINCIITISCIFKELGNFQVFLVFSMSIVFTFLTFKSINAYFDYCQLSETEGFPNFSEIVAYADDNSEYKSYYFERAKNNTAEDEEMPVPTNDVKNEAFTSKPAYMDDIPFNNPNNN